MANFREPGRGSLNVFVTVHLPQTLSLRQRRLYERLREQEPDTGGQAGTAAQS